MYFHIKFIGIILILLAVLHIIFPKYFNWRKDLAQLRLINRQMMIVHTFFIALTVFFMGLLCITSSTELIETHLGKKISLGLGIFWLCRLIIQFFGYSASLWKGKTFETIVHIAFSICWTYLTIIFSAVYFT
jgi:hypothetical protein